MERVRAVKGKVVMTNFYVHICENGHVKTDFRRVKPGQRCAQCGAPLIDSCPSCGELIKIWHYYGSVPRGPKADSFDRPDRCERCGAEFPWAGRAGKGKA